MTVVAAHVTVGREAERPAELLEGVCREFDARRGGAKAWISHRLVRIEGRGVGGRGRGAGRSSKEDAQVEAVNEEAEGFGTREGEHVALLD